MMLVNIVPLEVGGDSVKNEFEASNPTTLSPARLYVILAGLLFARIMHRESVPDWET